MKVQMGVPNGILLVLAMMTLQACSSAQAGPNGGDVVPMANSQATAEVVANADTGEVMVHTWDQNRREFAWNNCWRGGAAHGSMWTEMGERRRGMMGDRPGAGMGRQ